MHCGKGGQLEHITWFILFSNNPLSCNKSFLVVLVDITTSCSKKVGGNDTKHKNVTFIVLTLPTNTVPYNTIQFDTQINSSTRCNAIKYARCELC